MSAISDRDGDDLDVWVSGYGDKVLNIEVPDPDDTTYFVFDAEGAAAIRDLAAQVAGDSETDENRAKIALAVKYGCRVKFMYDHGNGAVERRVEPAAAEDTYFGGDSYDENGQLEGFRNFSYAKITDKVAVR